MESPKSPVKDPSVVPSTPRRSSKNKGHVPHTPKARSMGLRVVCATPHRGRAVDNYSLGDVIGKGAFASVYKAIHLRTAAVVAIKQIPLTKIKAVDSVTSEIELLQNLQHPNIVKYLGFMKDEQNLNIVLEYCENGSLALTVRKFGSMPENLVAQYMRQVLEGLVYLHDQGTIHRDIKGANILTTKDGVAKLADFGVATRPAALEEEVKKHGCVGTPHWMAPEVISMQEPTSACDVWSLGATVVELRTGSPPYGHLNDMTAMYAILQGDSAQLIPAESSSSLRDFLELCFEKNPALRVPARKLLAHHWIRKFGARVDTSDGGMRPRKLAAVPSRLNLRSIFDESAGGEDDYEDAFMSLGVFDVPPQKKSRGATSRAQTSEPSDRKPLQAFVDNSESESDFVLEADGLGSMKVKFSKAAITSPSLEGADPFDGLQDLEEDAPSEHTVAAVEETDKLAAHLERMPRRQLKVMYLRLRELVDAVPHSVRRSILQNRVLQRSIAILNDPTVGAAVAFLDLVSVVLEGDHAAIISFWLAGGLSFILSLATKFTEDDVNARVLRLLHGFCQVGDADFARQLAYREDAIQFIVRYFATETPEQQLQQASDVALTIFEACGPRHRADLWHHFGTYGLLARIVDLLHLIVNEQIRVNLYSLVASFQRCPSTVVGQYTTRAVLRRLVRAYLHLPPTSPYRTTILQFYRDVSTLPPVLDAMYRGGVVPHLIAALDKVYKQKKPGQIAHQAANCLVPTFYNYCRIGRSRQREVAEYGLLPLLHETVSRYPALREFAWPIFCALAHSGHPQCWQALWEADGLRILVFLVDEKGWEAAALAAVSSWMDGQPEQVREALLRCGGMKVLVKAIASQTSSDLFDAAFLAAAALFDRHRLLCRDVDAAELFAALIRVLRHGAVSSSTLVQILQVTTWILAEQPSTAVKAFNESGLRTELHQTNRKDGEMPVLVQRLLAKLP